MTDRENYLSLAKRKGFERIPISFTPCPSIDKAFREYLKEHPMELPFSTTTIEGLKPIAASPEVFKNNYYRDKHFKDGTSIDIWGVAHEPGSKYAFHMTYMHHPMENFDSTEQILAYPLPAFDPVSLQSMKAQADALHKEGKAVMGDMQCTVWEAAWYMRGMENLMCDMMGDDPMATVLLDRVTELSCRRAAAYAEAGADTIFLGDDVGTQRAIMMSISLYDEWLKPRLKKVIDTAKAINPDILIQYHSCGMVTDLVPSLIDAGIDILNPIQPEVMDFRFLHEKYGDKISFNGTIGTQSVLPFGTPEEVRKAVFDNLDIAGSHGGLLPCPTHMVEPEVPIENLVAYIEACRDYKR